MSESKQMHRLVRQNRIPARSMPEHLPAATHRLAEYHSDAEVQVQIFRHQSTRQSLTIPAVAEPLLVLIVSGGALVEERAPGEDWTKTAVAANDFFLTMSPEPYEMRWKSEADAGFEVAHVYLGRRLLDLAARDVFGAQGMEPRLREVSGGRDPALSRLVRFLCGEIASRRDVSSMYLHGIGHALAVYLVRHYGEACGRPQRVNALPVHKLHRAIACMREDLDGEFSLARLANDAGMSMSHFSRMFRKATGRSPSRYFIHLRMETACQLLLESDASIVDIALGVGYGSPSHFAQVFRRYTGLSPRAYRQGR